MKNTKLVSAGFTLIELLIVIAIIGILSSVVLASVNSARSRGSNSAIQQNLHDARTQAELYYSDNGESYAGVCDTVPTPGGTRTVHQNLLDAQAAWGTTTQAIIIDLNTAGDWDRVTCHDDALTFAAEVPFKESASGSPVMWCVDSTGVTKKNTSNLGAGDTTCD